MESERASLLAVGDRVMIRSSHYHRGERGTITNTPGKVMTGWTVRLDSGIVIGASGYDLAKTDDE